MQGTLSAGLGAVKPCLPILLALGLVSFTRLFDKALLPLLVQRIMGGLTGASQATGILMTLGGTAGLLSGIVVGRMADRLRPAHIAFVAAIGSGCLMIPQGLTHSLGILYAAHFGAVLFSGALEPVFQTWLVRRTPAAMRGSVLGWAATARSIGWAAGPLSAGALAAATDLWQVYVAAAGLYLMLLPVTLRVQRLVEQHPAETL